ncbi:MAG TPA: hypothetical protein VHN80_27490 [Kineosporiaceae bacterium]|nr:hypothetical protein [Kineosporiaceae bacterium]
MGVRRVRATGPGARVRLAGAALALLPLTVLATSCTGSSHRGSGMPPVVVSGRVVTAVCPQVPSPLRTTCTLTPTAGATVVLVGANGEPATSAVSGDDGSFSLTGSLAPGSSTVRATDPQPGAAGPATATVTIEVLAGSAGQRVNGLELRLDTGIR